MSEIRPAFMWSVSASRELPWNRLPNQDSRSPSSTCLAKLHSQWLRVIPLKRYLRYHLLLSLAHVGRVT